MPDNTPLSTPRMLVLAAAIALFFITLGVYVSHGSSYPAAAQPAASYQPQVTNAEVLHNWLPSDVYLYTIARIDDYLRANNLATSSLTIMDGVTAGDAPTYYFNVFILPAGHKLAVGVSVSNENGAMATTVTINQQLQTPQVPSTQPSALGATKYNGFAALIDAGLTATQSDELQQALEMFAPTAGNITINTTRINSGNLTPDGTSRPYTFPLSIDKNNYQATLNAIGLLKAQLILTDTNGKQVYKSAVISQGG